MHVAVLERNPELQLRPDQEEAVEFLLKIDPRLNNKNHKLLALDPGGGKTVCVCVALRGMESVLIVCLAGDWMKEMWAERLVEWGACNPSDIAIIRTGKDKLPPRPCFVIVNYELLLREKLFTHLVRRRYQVVVLDEAQKLKSLESQLSKKVLGGDLPLVSRAEAKWFLSGYIMPNNPSETYPIARTMVPHLIAPYLTWVRFTEYFCEAYYDTAKREWIVKGANHVEELRARLDPFIFARTFEEMFPDSPGYDHEFVKLDVDERLEKLIYDYIKTELEENKQKNVRRMLTEGFSIWEYFETLPLAVKERLVGIAKIPDIVSYVQARFDVQPNEKLLVFTRNRQVTEQVAEAFPKAVKYYGGMSRNEKEAAKQAFIEGEANLMVANIRSIGTGTDGLQLVCHNTVHAQIDWSEGTMQQSRRRVVREKQTKRCRLVSLVARRTVDESTVGANFRKAKVIKEFRRHPNGSDNKEGKANMPNVEELFERSVLAQERMATALESLASAPVTGNAVAKSEASVDLKVVKGSGDKAAKAAKSEAKAEKPAEKAEAPAETKAASAGDEEVKLTEDDVRKAAQKAVHELGGGEKGNEIVKTYIARFSPGKIQDMPKNQYQGFIDGLDDFVAETKAKAAAAESL